MIAPGRFPGFVLKKLPSSSFEMTSSVSPDSWMRLTAWRTCLRCSSLSSARRLAIRSSRRRSESITLAQRCSSSLARRSEGRVSSTARASAMASSKRSVCSRASARRNRACAFVREIHQSLGCQTELNIGQMWCGDDARKYLPLLSGERLRVHVCSPPPRHRMRRVVPSQWRG